MTEEQVKQPVETAPAPELLTVSPSPHAKRNMTTTRIMLEVILALLPATVWGIYQFGLNAAIVVLTAVVSSVLFEALTQWILKRPITVKDLSAALTGLLLGLNLSPSVPLYVPIVGSAFAIILVKQLFGGIGKNIMNPALAARVFLMLAWAGKMTAFPAAGDRSLDAVASATPLASLKTGVMPEGTTLLDLFLGKNGGCIGEISALLLLIGGIYLIVRKIVAWQIPVGFLATVAILTFLFPQGDMARFDFMIASLCSGGVMIGAFFMATDYVTSPVTPVGRLIYGVGCGLLVVFIRFFGSYNEGVSFAILIMNSLVWYLEMFTKPRVFGKARREKKKA